MRFERDPTTGRPFYSRKNEEYAADFETVPRRFLTPEDYELFRLHFLLGIEYSACCPALGLNRGQFFHVVDRIKETLGQVFATLEPYPLFPVYGYFAPARPSEPPPVVPKRGKPACF